jgi:hypothetical protein
MQNPHALSKSRAPDASIVANPFSAASIFNTCRDPGATPTLTSACTVCPSSILTTVFKSVYEEFVQDPINT